MAQPTPYNRQGDFTDWSAEHPADPHEGVTLDAEFNAIVATLAGVLANLAKIQRDDGALKNGSVGIDTLSAAALALINSGNGIVAAAWATATDYDAGTHWVSQGTATYICAISHTSGVFADDLAAAKWVKIHDSAGTVPADGSVTTPKLANGAVTLAKLAITLLDLTGYIRAQGGLAAGTASTGELLAAKVATGSALAKVERAAKTGGTKGIVGLRLGGGTGGVNWDIRQQADSDSLELYDGTAVRVTWTAAVMDVVGRIRATGDATPTAGAGIGLRYASGIGSLDCYDHSASAWKAAELRASTWTIVCGGVTVVSASATGVHFPVEATIGAGAHAIGYRGIPKNAQNGAYTLVASDAGKMIFSENVAGQTVTIPAGVLPVEAVVAIRNRGTNPITVDAAAVTLRWAGQAGTGNRTIAAGGLAVIYQEKTNEFVISGAGVS